MTDDYADIIDLPRPPHRVRQPMPRAARAAQFASFAALGDSLADRVRAIDDRERQHETASDVDWTDDADIDWSADIDPTQDD